MYLIKTKNSVEDTFLKIQQAVANLKYKTKTIVPNHSISIEGNRDFRWLWVVVLAILFWPVAILYYLTRKRNSITLVVNWTVDGCKITSTYTGKWGKKVLQSVELALNK